MPSTEALECPQTPNGHDGVVGQLGWTLEEDRALSKFITDSMKKNMLKPHKAFSAVPWDQAKIGQKSAAECKARWAYVSENIRSYRTMAEMAQDWDEKMTKRNFIDGCAQRNAKKHPEFPKARLSAYMIFSIECSTKHAKKLSALSLMERSKKLKEMFKALSDEDKKEYYERAKEDGERFEREEKEFYQKHPEFNRCIAKKSEEASDCFSILPKRQTPFELFKENLAKTEGVQTTDSQRIWRDLPDEEKVEWIKKALAAKEEYLLEVGAIAGMNPDAKLPKIKPILDRYKEDLIRMSEGLPEMPPVDGHFLFLQEQLKLEEHAKMGRKKAKKAINEKWRSLSEAEKADFESRADKAKEQYKERMKASKDKATAIMGQSDWRGVAKTGIYRFCVEKHAQYVKENVDLAEPELRRKMIAEFKALSEEEKAQYEQRARKVKIENQVNSPKAERMDTSGHSDSVEKSDGEKEENRGSKDEEGEEGSVSPKRTPKKSAGTDDESSGDEEGSDDGLPKPPPRSAMDVFVEAEKERYRKTKGKEIPANLLASVKKRWPSLKDKKKYEDQLKKMEKEYKESCAKVESGLSPKQKRPSEAMGEGNEKRQSAMKKRKASSSESDPDSEPDPQAESDSNSEPEVKMPRRTRSSIVGRR